MRLAIGATRGRIVRQVLTECLVLAGAGGALGALLGAAGVTLVKQLATVEAPGIFRLMFGSTILPRGHEVGVDLEGARPSPSASPRVTSVVFGVLPALHLSRTNHLHAMGSRGGGRGRGESRIRAALVVGQLVLATVLLVGAGLLIHSFVKLSTFDKGYDPSNVLAFNLLFPDQYSTARKADTIETLLTRFRGNPNVRSAGFSRHGLLIGEELYDRHVRAAGADAGRDADRADPRAIRERRVSDGDGRPGARRARARAGRQRDGAAGDRDQPIGGTSLLRRGAARSDSSSIGTSARRHVQVQVVGVVEDVRRNRPTDELVPEVFVDYRQFMHL